MKTFIFLVVTLTCAMSFSQEDIKVGFHFAGLNSHGALPVTLGHAVEFKIFLGRADATAPLAPRPVGTWQSRAKNPVVPFYFVAYCSPALHCTHNVDAAILSLYPRELNSTAIEFAFTPTTLSSDPKENYISIRFNGEASTNAQVISLPIEESEVAVGGK